MHTSSVKADLSDRMEMIVQLTKESVIRIFMLPTLKTNIKKNGGHIAFGLSVRPCVCVCVCACVCVRPSRFLMLAISYEPC